ncbi:uncharacterized small protein [Candidatus Methanoperedens nitroreducens]|uniref:Uncharacterized small protein n=1 Tax=Candidatus Methanoperedens nitratireducens TaxID=1392998 RepID=A0A062V6I3_9EURY|nr:UPF0175 family protein [Candidatus Methanoperedens nitroreducens]KCZ70980.1 uncharacterized small protein [Candidatus Methanoperedens nitroreducens]MDJ1421650.1 UPF0175 family protein [Candidatus Methanoperedens sp.]
MAWVIEELQKLSEIKPEAIERILEDVKNRSPDIFKSLVISAYLDEKISMGKAAEMLGITRIELQKEFNEKGIPVRVISKEDVIAEVEAMRAWK